MALLLDDLWGKVLRGATERVRLLIGVERLGQTEVNNFQVTILVDQNVLKLEVSMRKALLVKVTNG